jgi:hypothetical protein
LLPVIYFVAVISVVKILNITNYSFFNNYKLLILWPFNIIYSYQFYDSSYTGSEINWFFFITSSSSAVWIIILIVRIPLQISRSDTYYVEPAISGIFVAICIIVFGLFVGFNSSYSIYGPSLRQGITIGLLKVYIYMSVFYFCSMWLMDQIFLYIRHIRELHDKRNIPDL